MYVCDIMQKMYKELFGMIKNLQIIRVNTNYCDYLRKFDSRVAYNMNEKEIRPFIGILFKIEDCEYFAPLSSPKSKHKKMKPLFSMCFSVTILTMAVILLWLVWIKSLII